ncbi:MAG: RagB/SusD family nutrient uptake outer membrane protein, partial [Muribaculaceae bacterium]|nr:RagB/SusD family nutrient uptake outer membrane protein [Muribaculaceae bacterium]
MNSQYKFINISAGLLFCVSSMIVGGCSDELDKFNTQETANEEFWRNEKDAKLALVGCYRFQTGWSHDSFDTPQGLLYLDFAGGNGTEKESFSTNMASVNTTATNGNIRWYWGNAYKQIYKYNNFLQNIVNCPMDEGERNAMIAEMKTLRAYFFFNLAFYFKDAPMPLKTLSVNEANTIAQTSQADIYRQVEADLLESIEALPEVYEGDDYGRISRNGARVLLSRLYL